MKKLCFAALLVLALTAASLALAAGGSGLDGATLISGTPYTDEFPLPSTEQYWKITPEKSGVYYFSLWTDGADQWLNLYSGASQETQIASCNDRTNTCGFKASLTAGSTYYIGVVAYTLSTAGKDAKLSVGSCVLSDDGTMTVSIDGPTENFSGESSVPWHSSAADIKKVVFNGKTTTVGSYMFADCTALESVEFPDTLETVGTMAFSGCSALTQAVLPESLTSIGVDAFARTGLTKVTVPGNVTSIAAGAFQQCPALASVSFPDSLLTIGNYAFSSDKLLEEIIIPNGVTEISDGTFSSCSALWSVTLPDGIAVIGLKAFEGCSALTTLHYGGTKAQWAAIKFGNYNNYLLRLGPHDHRLSVGGSTCGTCGRSFPVTGEGFLFLPADLTVLSAKAFSGTAARVIFFPDGIKKVPAGVFTGCDSLEYVILPPGASVEDGAFPRKDGADPVEIVYRPL